MKTKLMLSAVIAVLACQPARASAYDRGGYHAPKTKMAPEIKVPPTPAAPGSNTEIRYFFYNVWVSFFPWLQLAP